MFDCDNINCCYYLDGKCNGEKNGYEPVKIAMNIL